MAAKKKVTKKKVAKKKIASKKRVGRSQTKASMATGKAPSPRLKSRRKNNTRDGYYPNPVTTMDLFVIKIIKNNKTYYFDGEKGTSIKKDAAFYRNNSRAKRIAEKVAGILGDSAKVFVEGTIAKK